MPNELYHHGILGQKWGRRRFQNSDGSLTAAGKKRYGGNNLSSDEKKKFVQDNATEKAYRKAVADNSKTKFAKNVVDETQRVVQRAKQMSDESLKNGTRKVKLDLSNMTDGEMREKINRELLERQYNSLFAPEVSTVSKGQKILNDTLSVAGNVLTVGSSALAIALAIKSLKR